MRSPRPSVVLLFAASCCFAADPPPRLPQPPIPPPQLPVRQYNAWQSIQAPLSRSRGYDDSLDDSPASGYLAPSGRLSIEPMPDVLDTVKRSPPRPRLNTLTTAAAQRAEIDRREYELYLHSGLNDQTAAATTAAEALDAVKADRDRELLAAQQNYLAQLTDPHVDRFAANSAYVEQTRTIQERYQTKRLTILGDPPTTQAAQ